MQLNPEVDWYFSKEKKWHTEINKLRNILLNCALTEELKWGVPCYSLQKKNIVLLHVFKEYCALLFFKGALLKDADKLLVQQTTNVQAARQIRFRNADEIIEKTGIIKAYILEAIEVEKAGLKVELKKTAEYKMPAEFQIKINKNAALKNAFYDLTPGRQRGYLLFFSSAKQTATREARIEKWQQQILKGKGLND